MYFKKILSSAILSIGLLNSASSMAAAANLKKVVFKSQICKGKVTQDGEEPIEVMGVLHNLQPRVLGAEGQSAGGLAFDLFKINSSELRGDLLATGMMYSKGKLVLVKDDKKLLIGHAPVKSGIDQPLEFEFEVSSENSSAEVQDGIKLLGVMECEASVMTAGPKL
jgi:hypothetical protein